MPRSLGMNCEACGHDNIEGARFCANCGITIVIHDANDPRVGQMVGGRYRITGVIGEGGMGIVYEAEQQMGTAVRKVAVKTLHSGLSKDPSVTARFHRECGTVAQLEHPNTIKVYDFGTMADGTLYIAMEHLAGLPLDKVIEEEGPLDPKRTERLLRQIAGSLEEAHGQGIIHRDLKPENVILINRAGEKDVVKLLDFGIAARTESADAEKEAKLTQQGMVLGTPPYMSPEQFTGKALDRRSDIYSLAVMAYEMLTGQLPFDATTPWQWATEHMTAQPRPFETMEVSAKIPQRMREAILKALAKDRDERFATVTEFVDALQKGVPDPQRSVVPGRDANVDTSTATAAMAAAPDFGVPAGGAAPTAAMPAQAPAVSAPGIAIHSGPALTRGDGSSSKGLTYGLIGAVVLLGGGAAVALMQSGGGAEATDDTAPLLTETVPAANIAPLDPTDEVAADPPADNDDDNDGEDPSPSAAGKTPSAGEKPNAGSKTPKAPTPTPTPKAPTPTPAPKAPTPPSTPPAVPAPPDVSKACDQCIALAGRQNITQAAVQYRACSDAGKQATCAGRARATAPSAAGRAAKKGNCSEARQIQAAALSMGAGSPRLDTVVASCK